jgi:opacity protein-like surface antigen
MKVVSKSGLLLAAALLACAAFAASAQAVVINPAGTQITGEAQEPTLLYGDVLVTCTTGTAVGTTSNPASDTVNVNVQFQEPCDVNGLDAQVTCTEDEVTALKALTADTNQGEVDALLTGFDCDVEVSGICTISVGAQDLSANNDADLINEGSNGSETIVADVDVFATNNNSLCGPVPSGTGNFSGNYLLDTAVSFD